MRVRSPVRPRRLDRTPSAPVIVPATRARKSSAVARTTTCGFTPDEPGFRLRSSKSTSHVPPGSASDGVMLN